MDYGELLYKAQENERKSSQQEVRCYKSGFAPPKKLERTVSTANVKKFLARKENEEKKKCLEARKKKEELLALRSQDKKAKRRIESMLKRTKSANMSVMADAIDNNNTADTLSGPMQCDEDDYGYVSQEASALYNKLMNKYSNMPAEPSPFTKMKKEVKDLSAAKDRVRAALRKEEDEADLPHKRKRKTKDDDSEATTEDPMPSEKESKSSSKEKNEKLAETIKRKNIAAPPPPSFQQLLKMAEEKKSQPVDFEKLIRNFPKEPDRPMTQKEKIEWRKEQERKINRERREKGLPPLPSQFDSAKSRSDKNPKGRIGKTEVTPVRTGESKESNSDDVPKRLNGESNKKIEPSKGGGLDKIKRVTFKKVDEKSKSLDRVKPSNGVSKLQDEDSSTALDDIDREIELLKRKRMLLEKNKVKAQTAPQQKEKPKIANSLNKSSQPRPPIDKVKNHETTKNHNALLPKDKPMLNSHKPSQARAALPGRVPPNRVPPNSMPRSKPKYDEKLSKKPKRRIDSESEEYDSELDDFIEDEDECEDYSSYIKEIFGYDKSRYSNVDDDECMESNFAQQMKEEFVSTKIGIMEDLEDIRQEQEEKKRLKARKMMKVKGAKGK